MSTGAKGALLAALLLFPLLPAAEAAGPETRPWAPYGAISEVVSIALAREGGAIAAALKEAVTAPTAPTGVPGVPGVPGAPAIAETDLSIVEFETGFARNGTVQSSTPFGRTHVAVSRDGTSIATLGYDGQTQAARTLRLQFLHLNANANWTSAPYERTFSFTASAIPAGVAVSDDGRRVAALTAEGTDYVLRGYAYGGATIESAFEIRAPGAPRALAVAGDFSRVLVAGQFPVGNFTYGGAYVLPFAQGSPEASWFDTSANNTDVVRAVASRDLSVMALAGADGRVRVFRDVGLTTADAFALGSGPAGNLTMSEDGARLAGTVGLTLTNVDITTSPPTVLWNATLGGQNVTGLAMNATGALLLASTGGTGGGIFAFDQGEKTPLWSIPGDSRGVAVDSAGTRVAYAQRAAIGAVRIPRALSMDLASGGKIAAQRTVGLPANESYEVNLRNDGATTERVVFEAGAPEVSVASDPAIVAVRPGAIVKVNLTVSVNQQLVGPRVFNVTARSLSSGLVDNVTISLAPRPTLDVKLFINETDVLSQPGVPSSITLNVINNGTSDAPVVLSASQIVSSGAQWDVVLSESSLTALRGTRTSVRVSVTPPVDVANGTSSTVTFTLQGQDIFDTARATFRVNPDLKVEVNATGVTKFIEPGHSASYNVTVTNVGSLPRDFEIFYTITESTGRSWAVDMTAQTVRLEPLQKRVIPVRIVAPADVLPNERAIVLVTARSLPEQVNETAVIDNVTLFGVAVPLRITTTTPTNEAIPFLSPAAILAAIILIAALPRRRRPT